VKTGHDAIVLTDKERIIQIGNNLLSPDFITFLRHYMAQNENQRVT